MSTTIIELGGTYKIQVAAVGAWMVFHIHEFIIALSSDSFKLKYNIMDYVYSTSVHMSVS